MVLKICKINIKRGPGQKCRYRDQESTCGNKLLKGYQKVVYICILTVSGLLLVDVIAVRIMLANALEFIPVIVCPQGCAC